MDLPFFWLIIKAVLSNYFCTIYYTLIWRTTSRAECQSYHHSPLINIQETNKNQWNCVFWFLCLFCWGVTSSWRYMNVHKTKNRPKYGLVHHFLKISIYSYGYWLQLPILNTELQKKYKSLLTHFPVIPSYFLNY